MAAITMLEPSEKKDYHTYKIPFEDQQLIIESFVNCQIEKAVFDRKEDHIEATVYGGKVEALD